MTLACGMQPSPAVALPGALAAWERRLSGVGVMVILRHATRLIIVVGVEGEPRNLASVVARRFMECIVDPDRVEEGAAMLGDDFVLEDRRKIIGLPGDDKTTFVSGYISLSDEVGVERGDVEVLAVRGDRLVLTRIGAHYPAGSELGHLSVSVLDDAASRLQRVVRFDLDDLNEAVVELDERWVELGGDREVVECFGLGRAAVASGDAEQHLATLTDDFVAIDHRPLGMPRRDRFAFAESNAYLVGTHAFLTELIEHTPPCVLGRFRMTSADGSRWDWLSAIAIRDGKWVVSHLFDGDDLEAARTTYHELVAEHCGRDHSQ